MKRTPRSTALLAGAAAACLVLTGCAGSGVGRSASAGTDSLRIATLTAAQSLDPAAAVGSALPYFQAVYDTLLRRAPDGTYHPMLATRWSWSSDRTRLALTLREGVEFADGTPFDGAAVKANMTRFKKGGGASAKTLAVLEDVEVRDAHHVTLRLTNPDPAMLFYLSDAAGLMASPAKFTGDSLKTTPDGTGPYTLDKSRTALGTKYVYTRKKDYWGEEPPYRTLSMSVFDNETAVVNGLKTGQIDSALLQDADQQAAIEADPRLTTRKQSIDFQGLLLFDRAGARTPALREAKVRQALNSAIDRDTMLDKIRLGRGETTDQVFGPGTRGYDKKHDHAYPHDPAKARKLLAEAGYPKGFTLKLPRLTAIVGDALAASLQSDFKAVGVRLDWESLDQASAVQKIYTDRAYSAMVMNIGQSATDWITVQDLVAPGAFNLFGSTDPTVKRLVPEIQRSTGAEATTAARRLNQHLVDQAWFVPFYRMSYLLVTADGVKAEPQSGMAVPSIYNYRPSRTA
ncbi:ABC transporter substrate-binding protein [Streptomyces sp. NEAU-H3]|uniref:ABC transporter substrate-binding protein n=1 Tax=Streptomyces sp. NEAU-H3 TaxID=2720636 RepID=UPI00143A041A|nr:ABC transporter substrate-binding protein [Streptomyces sp. NEAU-H3]NJA58916.1 ABC transporter substrate-binding protein [Streptomyces sp. NEAU-H3]